MSDWTAEWNTLLAAKLVPGKRPPRQTAPMPLILRKSTVQARIEGLNPDIWGEDDFSVVEGVACVGRIYRERGGCERQWRWLLYAQPPAPDGGMAHTLEEATAAFKQRYEEAKGGT